MLKSLTSVDWLWLYQQIGFLALVVFRNRTKQEIIYFQYIWKLFFVVGRSKLNADI